MLLIDLSASRKVARDGGTGPRGVWNLREEKKGRRAPGCRFEDDSKLA